MLYYILQVLRKQEVEKLDKNPDVKRCLKGYK
jgi:hypothetical protein